MSNLTKFSEGAAILQQVDVSDIFKNLALGIAEAQQKLDDNSVAQVIRLSQQQINGVSLLQLGFAPVFYAFQYADISASINLKMAMKESMEFGFGFDLSIANKKGYKESDRQFISENNHEEFAQEFKSSRTLTFKAKERNTVKVENKSFRLKEDLQALHRVEDLEDSIVSETSVDYLIREVQSESIRENRSEGIDIWLEGGFIRIEEGLAYKKKTLGVLKIRDYNDDDVDLEGDGSNDFTISGSFNDTVDLARTENTGTVYGVRRDGTFFKYDGAAWVEISSTLHFLHDNIRNTSGRPRGHEVVYGSSLRYGTETPPLTHHGGGTSWENHADHALIHQALRVINRYDSSAVITVTGYTDDSGSVSYNESLAMRRAESVKSHIFGSSPAVRTVQGTVSGGGTTDVNKRKATITLDADYIVFIDGNITEDATPEKSSSGPNKFIHLQTTPVASGFHILNASYGNIALEYAQDSSFEQVLTYVGEQLEHYSSETRESRHYFLHNESIMKFHLFSMDSEDISIDYSREESLDTNETEDTFMSGKTMNSSSMAQETFKDVSKDNTFALGANVDFRMAKQFEMSMEGNASMSARLVAVPAPESFLNFVQNTFITTDSDNE